MKLISTNPAKNYNKNGTINSSTDEEIIQSVKNAHDAKKNWKNIGISKRIEYLKNLFSNFNQNKIELANLITQETGKPISQTIGEIDFFQTYNEWTLENANDILKDEIIYEDGNSIHTLKHEPHGVVAIILPWNSAFGLLSWKVFSSLITGNTIIIKQSEDVPLFSKKIESIVKKIHFPDGVINFVFGDEHVGEKLTDQNINLINFTGSSSIGKKLYKKAANKFIKVILELGGSNPGIIFEDSDIDDVIGRVFAGRFSNCGQNCDSLKRLIVHDTIYEDVLKKLKIEMQSKKIGDPENKETYFGTLCSKKQFEVANAQLNDALDKGAKIFSQKEIPENLNGSFFTPIILTNVTNNMKIMTEEVFAPILPVLKFSTKDDAVKIANDTNFGLGATIFTKNKKLFDEVSNDLMCGNVDHNNVYQWLPCNPFGGFKDSGIGRENGKQGLLELTQIKVVSREKLVKKK
jgi:succinate-semialdehyde dehydrogenase / glutarate-semialdehyde dehydrogenase